MHQVFFLNFVSYNWVLYCSNASKEPYLRLLYLSKIGIGKNTKKVKNY